MSSIKSTVANQAEAMSKVIDRKGVENCDPEFISAYARLLKSLAALSQAGF